MGFGGVGIEGILPSLLGHAEPASPCAFHICALLSRAAERHLFWFCFVFFAVSITDDSTAGPRMLLLRLLAVIRWRAHKPQLNNQAVTHAALSSLLGKKKKTRTRWPKSWREKCRDD